MEFLNVSKKRDVSLKKKENGETFADFLIELLGVWNSIKARILIN